MSKKNFEIDSGSADYNFGEEGLAEEFYPEGIKKPKKESRPGAVFPKLIFSEKSGKAARPESASIMRGKLINMKSYYVDGCDDSASRLRLREVRKLLETIFDFEQKEKLIDFFEMVDLLSSMKINTTAIKHLGWEFTESEAKDYGLSLSMIEDLKQKIRGLQPTVNNSREKIEKAGFKVVEREQGRPKILIRKAGGITALSRLYMNEKNTVDEIKTYIFRDGEIVRVEHKTKNYRRKRILFPLRKKKVMEIAKNTEERCLITNAALTFFGYESREEYFGKDIESISRRTTEEMRKRGGVEGPLKPGEIKAPLSLLGLKKR